MEKLEIIVRVFHKTRESTPSAEATIGGATFRSRGRTEGEAVAELLRGIFHRMDLGNKSSVRVLV